MTDSVSIVLTLFCLTLVWLTIRDALGIKRGEWLYNALTSIGDALITTDKKGCVTSINDVAEKLTGWASSQAKGKALVEVLRIVNHDTRAPVEGMVENVLSTGGLFGWIKNSVLIARNGNENPVDYNAAPICGIRGNMKGAVIIFRDTTEHYAAEQKLLESEERMRAVTSQARIGLVMVDRDRRYVYANNFYNEMLGITNTNLLGKRVQDVIPVLYEQIRPKLDQAFNGQRVTYELNGMYNKHKGLNRYYSVTYEPQARHSLIMHVVIVIVDITEIKLANLALRGGISQSAAN